VRIDDYKVIASSISLPDGWGKKPSLDVPLSNQHLRLDPFGAHRPGPDSGTKYGAHNNISTGSNTNFWRFVFVPAAKVEKAGDLDGDRVSTDADGRQLQTSMP